MIIVKATFIGQTSLGYVRNRIYALVLTLGSKLNIARTDGEGVCRYDSLHAFFQNWEKVQRCSPCEKEVLNKEKLEAWILQKMEPDPRDLFIKKLLQHQHRLAADVGQRIDSSFS
jgi:hypothetical protein